ncbi:MAG: hypothetical protein ABI361_06210 [Nitrososphaera sp.]
MTEQRDTGKLVAGSDITVLPESSPQARSLDLIIQHIKRQGIRKLQPVLQPRYGYSYPDLGIASFESQREVLEHLKHFGVASQEGSVIALKCPDCLSYALSFKLRCQSCKSGDLDKGSVIEHIPCGNTDFDERYLDDSGRFVCRKCNKRLNSLGVDYARPGAFYRCLTCKALLPTATKVYACLGCGKESLEDRLAVLRLPIYSINAEMIDKYAQTSIDIFQSLPSALADKGLKAVCPCPVVGECGIPQKFSIVIYGSGDQTRPLAAGDFIDQTDSDETRILSLFAKCMDTKIRRMMIISSKGLSNNASKLASAYGFKVFQPDAMNQMEGLQDRIIEWALTLRSETLSC